MKTAKVLDLLEYVMSMEEQAITPFLIGKPGIGKSDLPKQVAKRLGYDIVLDIRLSQHDNTDIKGIPSKNDKGELVWLAPEFLPVEGSKYEGTKGVLFFDELNRAQPDVQQSIFEIVYDRSIGMKKILPGWFILAAGNLGQEDGTDVVEMDSALKNRFQMVNVESPTINEWVIWAKKNNVKNVIIDFLRGNPQYLYYEEGGNIVTPRSWAKFSKLIDVNPDEAIFNDVLEMMSRTMLFSIAPVFMDYAVTYVSKGTSINYMDILDDYNESVRNQVKKLKKQDKLSLLESIKGFFVEAEWKELSNGYVKKVIRNFSDFVLKDGNFSEETVASTVYYFAMNIGNTSGDKSGRDIVIDTIFEENPEFNDENSYVSTLLNRMADNDDSNYVDEG